MCVIKENLVFKSATTRDICMTFFVHRRINFILNSGQRLELTTLHRQGVILLGALRSSKLHKYQLRT